MLKVGYKRPLPEASIVLGPVQNVMLAGDTCLMQHNTWIEIKSILLVERCINHASPTCIIF